MRVADRLRISDINLRAMIPIVHAAATAALRYVTGVVFGRKVIVTTQTFPAHIEVLGVRQAGDGVV